MKTILLSAALLTASAPHDASKGDEARVVRDRNAELEIIAVERELDQARLKGDVAVMDRLLADDYIGTSPLGYVRNKAQALDLRRTGQRRSQALESDDVRVRVFGDAAVLTSGRTERGEFKGKDVSGRYRLTHVYVRQDGRWRLVAAQTTPIIAPASQ